MTYRDALGCPIEAQLPCPYGESPYQSLHRGHGLTPKELRKRKTRREEAAADGIVAMSEYLAEPEQGGELLKGK
jgi:hypothetical protein